MPTHDQFKQYAHKYLTRIKTKYGQEAQYTADIDLLEQYEQGGQYDEFFKKFDSSFGKADFDAAKGKFSDPSYNKKYVGTKDGLICSYIKFGKTIKRRGIELGHGAFGRVKQTKMEEGSTQPPSALKRVKLELSQAKKDQFKDPLVKFFYFQQLLTEARKDISERAQKIKTKHLNLQRYKDTQLELIEQNALNPLIPLAHMDQMTLMLSHINKLKAEVDLMGKQLQAEAEELLAENKRLEDWEKNRNYDALIDAYFELSQFKKEAKIALDQDVAISDVIVINKKDGTPYKASQDMRLYQLSLDEAIKAIAPQGSLAARGNYALDCILSLMEMHNGESSLSKTRLAHLDIKPDNIRVDENGKVHFIDFGLAKTDSLDTSYKTASGTALYMPRDYNGQAAQAYLATLANPSTDPFGLLLAQQVQLNFLQAINADVKNPVQETPNPRINDLIALLRVIWHPWSSVGLLKTIYSREDFEKLPLPLKEILDTSDINRCITFFSQARDPLQFLASVFVLYNQDASACTPERIKQLLTNPAEQARLLNPVQEPRRQAQERRNKERWIQLLIDSDIQLQNIPYPYRKDPDLVIASHHLDPNALDFTQLTQALKKNIDFMEAAFHKNPNILEHVAMKDFLPLIQTYRIKIKDLPERFQNDPHIILSGFLTDLEKFEHSITSFNTARNKEIILAVYQLDPKRLSRVVNNQNALTAIGKLIEEKKIVWTKLPAEFTNVPRILYAVWCLNENDVELGEVVKAANVLLDGGVITRDQISDKIKSHPDFQKKKEAERPVPETPGRATLTPKPTLIKPKEESDDELEQTPSLPDVYP